MKDLILVYNFGNQKIKPHPNAVLKKVVITEKIKLQKKINPFEFDKVFFNPTFSEEILRNLNKDDKYKIFAFANCLDIKKRFSRLLKTFVKIGEKEIERKIETLLWVVKFKTLNELIEFVEKNNAKIELLQGWKLENKKKICNLIINKEV